jgi:hypothetical protein
MKDAALSAMIGYRIWEQRSYLEWREAERDEEHSTIEYPTVLLLPGDIRLEIEPASWKATVEMGGHVRRLENWHASEVIRAWRAVQAWNIALELGETMDPAAVMRGRLGAADLAMVCIGRGPRRWGGQNMVEHLDRLLSERSLSGRISRLDTTQTITRIFSNETYQARTSWYDVGDGVLFAIDTSWDLHGTKWHLVVKHARHGNVIVPCRLTKKAVEKVRGEAFDAVLNASAPLALPATAGGNARIARIAMLCREALAIDPDLADRSGMPIRPLVERHLPDLLARHAEAARISPSARLAEVDADLDRGVEIVRLAVEEALTVLSDRKRSDLATQLRFLESRHPANTIHED